MLPSLRRTSISIAAPNLRIWIEFSRSPSDYNRLAVTYGRLNHCGITNDRLEQHHSLPLGFLCTYGDVIARIVQNQIDHYAQKTSCQPGVAPHEECARAALETNS